MAPSSKNQDKVSLVQGSVMPNFCESEPHHCDSHLPHPGEYLNDNSITPEGWIQECIQIGIEGVWSWLVVILPFFISEWIFLRIHPSFILLFGNPFLAILHQNISFEQVEEEFMILYHKQDNLVPEVSTPVFITEFHTHPECSKHAASILRVRKSSQPPFRVRNSTSDSTCPMSARL